MNATSASPAEAGRSTGAPAPSRRTVDAPTRAFHWLLALSFLGAWLSSESERWRLVHATLGYTIAGLLVFRLLWGVLGPRHARLSLWLARLRNAPALLLSLRRGRPNWAALRPLLQALAVVSLLALAAVTSASGWALYDELFGGALEEAMEEVHEAMGNAMLLLVLLHVALVAGGLLLKGPRELQAMLTGRIPGRGPDLVKHDRAALAGLVLAAVLAFWGWQWQGAPGVSAGDGVAGGEVRALSSERGSRHEDDDD